MLSQALQPLLWWLNQPLYPKPAVWMIQIVKPANN